MPNHIHLILVPSDKEGLNRAVGEAHRRYTRMINFRDGWRGHLRQGRFSSCIMDERYLVACTKYIELNPVRAKLANSPFDWPWSSARYHLEGIDSSLLKTRFLKNIIKKPWDEFLTGDVLNNDMELFRKHERTESPWGILHLLKKLKLCWIEF
jgi:putative transposase